MKSKKINCGDFFQQYIDKDEFYSLVKAGKLKIEKEWPNPACIDASGIHFNLMSDDDWKITIKKNDTFGDGHKYKVVSNMGRFPSACVTIEEKPYRIPYTGITRYSSVYAGDIDHTEYGGSNSMVTNDKNGPRRKMLVDNGFTVIEEL